MEGRLIRRDWNDPLFSSELDDDEEAAQRLASVAEPAFLAAVKSAISLAQHNGEKVCIATHRGKYDADGQRVDGSDGAGKFRTDGYEVATADETVTVERAPELEGVTVSHMLALELALDLTPDILRSILDIKVILDRLGGQVWIAPYVHEEQVVGFAFLWDHISRLGRGKEPDANISEPLPLVVAGSANGNG